MSSEIDEAPVTVNDLPMEFKVKYIGKQPARGLWGIKHTRKPVDHLVTVAKTLSQSNKILPMCSLTVSTDGVYVESIGDKIQANNNYRIETISYGVQDLVYTRVFAMIIVKDDRNINVENIFEVHAFVCDSRTMAKKLTFALAAAFQEYSKRVKDTEEKERAEGKVVSPTRKKFAIDLRSPEEQKQELDDLETEA